MPNNDPPRSDPFRPPEPQPYRSPDWNPSQRPPFEPPQSPNPVDPTKNPWQNPGGVVGLLGLALMFLCLACGAAFAAAVGGGGTMPWDTPLQNIQTDLTGTTATLISGIGIVGVFGVLIFGGELNHFARSLCFIIMCVSVLVAGNNLLTDFGITGATVVDETRFHVYEFVSGGLITSLFWVLALSLHRRYRRLRASQAQVQAVGKQSA